MLPGIESPIYTSRACWLQYASVVGDTLGNIVGTSEGAHDGFNDGDADGSCVGATLVHAPSTHSELLQSLSSAHVFPFAHRFAQVAPPQSTSLSPRFSMPSLHAACVGHNVGVRVGDSDGAGVGDTDGEPVGAIVGSAVGTPVGASVFSQHHRNTVRLPSSIGQHVASGGMPVSSAAHLVCRRQSPGVVGDADGAAEGDAEGAGDGDAEGARVGASVLSQQGRYVLLSIAGQQSMLWPSANQCPQRGCRLQWPGDVGAGVNVGEGDGFRVGCFAHHSAKLNGTRVGASDGRAVTITGNDGAGVGDRDGECDGQSVSGPKQQSKNAPCA